MAGLTLECPKCRSRAPLSEADVVLFYPKFRCLQCGEEIPIPLTEEEAAALQRKPDLDRKLPEE